MENLEIIPVTKEVIEKREDIATFKKQEGDLLFKIWPENDLEPGEYALIEYTEGKSTFRSGISPFVRLLANFAKKFQRLHRASIPSI